MAIKMRVLCDSKKGKINTLASMIKQEYDLPINALDKIPPAYSCDKERVVILMLSLKGEPENYLRLFCREMTKARAQNTALIIDGTEAAAKTIVDLLKEGGTNVFEEVLYIKGGFALFKNATDEEKEQVRAFCKRVVENLQ